MGRNQIIHDPPGGTETFNLRRMHAQQIALPGVKPRLVNGHPKIHVLAKPLCHILRVTQKVE